MCWFNDSRAKKPRSRVPNPVEQLVQSVARAYPPRVPAERPVRLRIVVRSSANGDGGE